MARSRKNEPEVEANLSSGFNPEAPVDEHPAEVEAPPEPPAPTLPKRASAVKAVADADAAVSNRLAQEALDVAAAAERVLHRLAASAAYRPGRNESFPVPSPSDAHVLRAAGFTVEPSYPNLYPLAKDLHRVACERRQRAARGTPAELEALERAAKAERVKAERRSMEIEESIRLLQLELRKVEDAAEAAEAARDTMANARRDLSRNLPPVLEKTIAGYVGAKRRVIDGEAAAARERLEEIEAVLSVEADEVSPAFAARQSPGVIDRREFHNGYDDRVNAGRWEAYQRECEREAERLRPIVNAAIRKENDVLLAVRRATDAWLDHGLAEALQLLSE